MYEDYIVMSLFNHSLITTQANTVYTHTHEGVTHTRPQIPPTHTHARQSTALLTEPLQRLNYIVDSKLFMNGKI